MTTAGGMQSDQLESEMNEYIYIFLISSHPVGTCAVIYLESFARNPIVLLLYCRTLQLSSGVLFTAF